MPILMVRGTADTKRPYNGGPNLDGQQCRSAADDVAYWTSGDACVLAPIVTELLVTPVPRIHPAR